MKLRFFKSFAGLTIGLLAFGLGQAEEAAAPAPSPLSAELTRISERVAAKRQLPSLTPEMFAPEFADLDALLKKHPEKTNEVGSVLMIKAYIYYQVLHDEDTGKKLLLELKANYPGTDSAALADRVLEYLTPEGKAKFAAQMAERAAREKESKAKIALLGGRPAPALHFIWSSQGGLKSMADLKGQVVVLDFFATWCGPCIASFPFVREEVARFRNSPVKVLGVTSLQGKVYNLESKPIVCTGDPTREMGLMPAFMKKHEMTWDVAFSEEKVYNPDYAIQGIPYIAIVAPDGTLRHAGLYPSSKDDIGGKIEAILKEFHLPSSPAKG